MIETSSDIPGIRQIDYQLQSLDYTGKPIDGKFNATPYTKTLIDEANHPGLTAKVEQWGKEALANGQYGKGNGSQLNLLVQQVMDFNLKVGITQQLKYLIVFILKSIKGYIERVKKD